MIRTFSVDDKNDIFVGDDGALAIAAGIQAVLHACAQAAKTQLGELLFAVDSGVPNFDVVWARAPNTRQFEAYLRRNLTAVQGVVSVESVTISVAGNALSYTAVIRTIYGSGSING